MEERGKDFRKVIEQIARTHSSVIGVFSDFCRMVACRFTLNQREDEFVEVTGKYSRDEMVLLDQAMGALIEEMQGSPFKDCLGPFYTEILPSNRSNTRGEFYTPPEIGKAMAMMTIDSEKVIGDGKPITVSDPCCGSGGLILAVAELFAPKTDGDPSYVDLLRVSCIDVNPVAADMCYINTTLWGIPAEVICGNTLSLEMQSGWRNLHWIRVGEDDRRAFARQAKAMIEFLKDPLTHPATMPPSEEIETSPEQSPQTGSERDRGRDGDQITFGF